MQRIMRGDWMEWIMEWVRGLAFYLILMTVVLNLLPDKTYEKYLRLFTGMVFILLVFRPFADLTGLEARMAGAFERITFQNDAKLLKREIMEAEEVRLKKLTESFQDAVELDLKTMAEGSGLVCKSVEIALNEDGESESFGALLSVKMEVALLGGGENLSREEEENRRMEANREIAGLRKRIGEYYGLEEGFIEIRLEAQ
jgi:stage III sporulation protein AF